LNNRATIWFEDRSSPWSRAGTELPNDAAAREFAAKVMRGLLDQREDDWHGWTMEVREGQRRVWQLPFDAI